MQWTGAAAPDDWIEFLPRNACEEKAQGCAQAQEGRKAAGKAQDGKAQARKAQEGRKAAGTAQEGCKAAREAQDGKAPQALSSFQRRPRNGVFFVLNYQRNGGPNFIRAV